MALPINVGDLIHVREDWLPRAVQDTADIRKAQQ